MLALLSIIALFAVSQAAPQDLHFFPKSSSSAFDDIWAAYKVQYGKTYESLVEDYRRQTIFADNLKIMESHNYLYDMGLKTYRMGINHLTDMNSSEVIQQMTGYNMELDPDEDGTTYLSPNGVVLPDTVDWRDEGYVTPVKNQGNCGSCWSFSTTGSLEGQTKKKTGNLVSLSEQNLVDCSKAQGNYGCTGGLMSNAFRYIKANGGLDTEESYPYEGKDLECRYKEQGKGAAVTGYVNIEKGSEEKLQEAVATVGPVSVGINVQPSFMTYSSGIYYDKNCEPTHLRHAVLVVGYGTEKGLDFWLVKNSWGTSWGEKGYIRMARNKDNHCGIASDGIYPLV